MDISSLLGDDLIGFCLSNEATAVENNDHVDHLLLAAYELLDCSTTSPCSGTSDTGSQQLLPLPSTTQPRPSSTSSRFATPITEEEITEKRKSAIPDKTKKDTQYCISVWEEWREHRRQTTSSTIPPLNSITPSELQYWLLRFIHEVRKKNGSEYPPNTLLHLCTGIVRYLRSNGHPSLDIFKDSAFAEFRSSLDAEMKRLQAKGLGSKQRQAEPITEDEEDLLWEKGLLGDHTPDALLNTVVYMNGLYFALRSGKEHRNLRHSPSQIEIVERDGERPYLLYTEDCSKNHPGGLKGRRINRKVVKHYANTTTPQKCFVRILKKYRELCPPHPKNNAFYLRPLKEPSESVWFSREPLGHNKLAKIVTEMCSKAGIDGFRTNHSLRATSATRLFSAGADEQLIMERTGHRSVDGVRSYKRTSDHLNEAVSDILNRSVKRSNSSYPPATPSSSSSPAIPLLSCPPVIPTLSGPPAMSMSPCPPAMSPSPCPPAIPPSSCPPALSLPVSLPCPAPASSRTWPLNGDPGMNPYVMSYNNSTTNTPGTFSFNSCNSVVININK